MRYAVVIHTDTTSKEAVADYMEQYRRRTKRERERRQRRWYFIRQRLYGIGDATVAVITLPLGLALIFSRQKLVVNDYYFETEERQAGND